MIYLKYIPVAISGWFAVMSFKAYRNEKIDRAIYLVLIAIMNLLIYGGL